MNAPTTQVDTRALVKRELRIEDKVAGVDEVVDSKALSESKIRLKSG